MAAQSNEIFITLPIHEWVHSLGHLAGQAFRWHQRQRTVLRDDGGGSDRPHSHDSAFSCTALLSLATIIECFESRLRWKIWFENIKGVQERFRESQYKDLCRQNLFGLFSDTPLDASGLNEVLAARNCITHAHIWTYKLSSAPGEMTFVDHEVGRHDWKFRECINHSTWRTTRLDIPVIAKEFGFLALASCVGAAEEYFSQWRVLDTEIDPHVCQGEWIFHGRAALESETPEEGPYDNILTAICRAAGG